MNLERLTVEIRPRTPWEAIDLGFIIARRWYWRLWYLWLVGAVPALLLFLVVTTLLPLSVAKWCLILFWVGKPLYEPPLLIWLSKALFGDRQPYHQILQEFKKIMTVKRFCYILAMRLSLSRSFSMPVLLLEGLEGKKGRQRLSILQDGYEPAFLSFASFFIELILTFTIMSLLYYLVPESLRWIDFGDFIFTIDSWMILGAYVLSCSIFAPLYICSGFMLYISRRVQLEAWDIEIGFKRIRQRLFKRKNGLKHTVITLFLVMTIFSGFGTHSDAYAKISDPEKAKEIIGEVLADRKFGEEVTRYHWVPKDREEKVVDSTWAEAWQELLESIAQLFENIGPIIGKYGKIALLCFAGIVIIILLLKHTHIRRWLNAGLAAGKNGHKPVEVLFGMDLRPESLPDDLGKACLELLNSGRKREAMSLLYRGTLSRLVNDHGLDILASFTENECCQEVRSRRPTVEANFFDNLTSLWIITAYGHRDPDGNHCSDLVDNWQSIYGAKS
ncbi:MAG: hypothetical protein QNJ17_01550 [Desulfocapsaceae bacterium]|nr:hypothetical protein [Desulfocapsaceae bacterium]